MYKRQVFHYFINLDIKFIFISLEGGALVLPKGGALVLHRGGLWSGGGGLLPSPGRPGGGGGGGGFCQGGGLMSYTLS